MQTFHYQPYELYMLNTVESGLAKKKNANITQKNSDECITMNRM